MPGSISVLSDVVDAVGSSVPMIFDGSVRQGIDVFRALALGAAAVTTARPVLYGAPLGKPSGVASVLEHLRDELRSAMLLAGMQTVADIKRDCLRMRNA